ARDPWRGDRHPGGGESMSVDGILKEAEEKMGKSVDHLEHGLQTIRTGRANPALIEHIRVPYYGTPTPLNQLAQISAPEPRLLVVQVYDRSQMPSVEKAIRDAGRASGCRRSRTRRSLESTPSPLARRPR